MIEHTFWHPVALVSELTDQPLGMELLGEALVLWRDAEGQPHAWADRCPHRGAQLSLGRVCNGHLECPYHGWQFDAHGQCTHVPALPGFKAPATHVAHTHAAQEAYGLVWVCLQADAVDGVALPVFAAETDAQLRKVNCGPYDVATSAPRIIENFLDMAHFGFVHDGWLGMREATAIDDYTVEPTPTGLRATQCKAWQPQSNVHSTAPAQVEYTYEVVAPYTAVLTKVPDAASVALQGFRESIALFICPLTPESSRVWFRLAMADFTSPDTKLQDFQHTIFMQDKPVLESQTPKRLPLDLRAELHTAADKASSAYRRYLKQQNITFGVC
ncbi:aromatic ring-hydroxylating dioxygenase subunit alpha [Rhodoferax saidenbachensis]|uniref:Phenylpropionate dioxygenase-like ring-hydroxylating dioxygenase large terminal subunit n=1 Tax=Rhodoferax saidenbachensis TaxID=1484693 RepID=A0ABU1ZQP3_9BURK|nr:aromatic ring-hydroxylating dioxygenase subunit alpha [Rhodoferax saidenbachensis]MDR7307859.1 phenylpropionate dioxygenase-like ring-hydroxylating dioxygenase large terminal subunit [Rhodoferax saidenbachensis]